MHEPNTALTQIAVDVWEAVAGGDRDTLERLCAPGVVWESSGRGRWAGARKGLDEVCDYLAALGEASEKFSSEFQDVLVSERRAAVLFRVSGSREGRSLETDFILLFDIEAGRITRIRSISRDPVAVDAFWA